MNSLYEKIDGLKVLTILKENESIIKLEDPIITHISLYYGSDLYREIVLVEAVKGFNNFDNKGYLVANMRPFIEDETFPGFFTALNEVKMIIVYFSNDTKKEYGITWCSAFDKIDDDTYIMLFETKTDGYYKENSKI